MGKRFGDEEHLGDSPQIRRHLAIIQAHSELLLETGLGTQEDDALARIHRSTLELETLVTPDGDSISLFPDGTTHDTIKRALVCSQNEYFSRTLDALPTQYGDIDWHQTSTPKEAESILVDIEVDRLIVDAVWPDQTGIDVIADLQTQHSVPPYALMSISSDGGDSVTLVLSGICSPTISATHLDQILEAYVDPTDEVTVAGFFSDHPGGDIGARIDAHPDTVIDDPSTVASRVTPSELTADAVCLDLPVYHEFSQSALSALRSVNPGRGRPLVLVARTDNDPYDREWIPTLGSREFLHQPPTVASLLKLLIVDQMQ